jgi:endonuclease III
VTHRDRAQQLLEQHGRTFADEAGIGLKDTPSPLWQLLVLSILLSSRISAELAVRAAREVTKAFRTPQAMVDATEHQVWEALDRGDYLRKDRTASMLKDAAQHCVDRWDGDLRTLRDTATGVDDMAELLREFKGIGEVGAEVFLREVQAVWDIGPYAGARALDRAAAEGLPEDAEELAGLVDRADVPRLMAALVRTGLEQNR